MASSIVSETGASSATAPAGCTTPPERPMCVTIRPYNMDFWEYVGSRAQLEAEGVIPPCTKWPDGVQNLRWETGRFQYWLRRTRPEGLKGPMKLWTSGDWWCLRCDLIDGPDHATLRILDKKRELAEALYRQSPAGQREWNAQLSRLWKSREDEAFQAFKSTFIPKRKKPGRKPKAHASEGAQK